MKFHEDYKAKGLSIIMLSTEDVATVKPYAPANNIPFIVAVSDKSVLNDYEVRGFPSSFLIDGTGKVIWEGHPMNLQASQIEAALKTVQLFKLPEVAPALKAAKTAYEGERFADAEKKAQAVLKKRSASEKEKTDAQMIVDKVREAALKRIQWADEAASQGNFSEAFESLAYVQTRFKGLDVAKEAKDREKAIRKSPAAKKELRAVKILESLLKREAATRGTRNKKKLIPVFEAFAKKYAGTASAKKAEDKARQLINLLP